MVELILWGLIALLGLSFLGISLPDIVNSPTGQENFMYIWHLAVSGWEWIVALTMSIVDYFF
jgi:hypothetical protein